MRIKGLLSVGQFGQTLIAFALGSLLALLVIPQVEIYATLLSDVFMRLLRVVSVPIIFLSLIVTISKVNGGNHAGRILKIIVRYTLATTLIAATVALAIYRFIEPASAEIIVGSSTSPVSSGSYLEHALAIIPSNFIQPFLEGNVLAVLLVALGLGFAIAQLEDKPRDILHSFFDACFQTVMKLTSWIIKLLPIAVFGFAYLFVRDLRTGPQLGSVGLYLLAVVGANFIQGFVVLPLILKFKGLSPIKSLKAMWPALSLAFFSKSSASTIPLAIKCAEDRAGISGTVARFSFPLCTTINMNACAGFILITTLFVAHSSGVTFTNMEMISWIFIATIAAIGNAGVPMGCYFLTGALLSTMNVPLTLLGVILPFYTVIDMLETAINVWSDSCVTAMADKDLRETVPQEKPEIQELVINRI